MESISNILELNLNCCSKCKGLFKASKDDNDKHFLTCSGNPFKSSTSYFACERKIFLQLFQPEDFQLDGSFNYQYISKDDSFLNQVVKIRLPQDTIDTLSFLRNYTTASASTLPETGLDLLDQNITDLDTVVDKDVSFVDDEKSGYGRTVEDDQIQNLINKNLDYLKHDPINDLHTRNGKEPFTESPSESTLLSPIEKHLDFLTDESKSTLESPFDKGGGFLPAANVGFQGNSLSYAENQSVSFSCSLSTGLLGDLTPTQEEHPTPLSSIGETCQSLQLPKKDPFLGQNPGLSQLNSKDPFLINASDKEHVPSQKYIPPTAKSIFDLQTSPTFQLQDGNYFNFPSMLDEPTQLDYLDLATLDFLTNPNFTSGLKEKCINEKDEQYTVDDTFVQDQLNTTLSFDSLDRFDKTMALPTETRDDSAVDRKRKRFRLKKVKTRLPKKTRTSLSNENINSNYRSSESSPRTRKNSAKELDKVTMKANQSNHYMIGQSNEAPEKSSGGPKITSRKRKLSLPSTLEVGPLEGQAKLKSERKQLMKNRLCQSGEIFNVKDTLVGFSEEEKDSFKAVLGRNTCVLVKKQKLMPYYKPPVIDHLCGLATQDHGNSSEPDSMSTGNSTANIEDIEKENTQIIESNSCDLLMKCPSCNFNCKTVSELKKHYCQIDTSPPCKQFMFTCCECDFTCDSVTVLSGHMKIHNTKIQDLDADVDKSVIGRNLNDKTVEASFIDINTKIQSDEDVTLHDNHEEAIYTDTRILTGKRKDNENMHYYNNTGVDPNVVTLLPAKDITNSTLPAETSNETLYVPDTFNGQQTVSLIPAQDYSSTEILPELCNKIESDRNQFLVNIKPNVASDESTSAICNIRQDGCSVAELKDTSCRSLQCMPSDIVRHVDEPIPALDSEFSCNQIDFANVIEYEFENSCQISVVQSSIIHCDRQNEKSVGIGNGCSNCSEVNHVKSGLSHETSDNNARSNTVSTDALGGHNKFPNDIDKSENKGPENDREVQNKQSYFKADLSEAIINASNVAAAEAVFSSMEEDEKDQEEQEKEVNFTLDKATQIDIDNSDTEDLNCNQTVVNKTTIEYGLPLNTTSESKRQSHGQDKIQELCDAILDSLDGQDTEQCRGTSGDSEDVKRLNSERKISIKSMSINRGLKTSTSFKCENCSFESEKKADLNRHKEKYHGEYLFCDVPDCQFRTKYKRNLVHHKTKHEGVKKYLCDKCPYSTPDATCFNSHQKYNHTHAVRFKCTDCDFTSVIRPEILRHYRNIHLQQKIYACNQCDYKTGYTYLLKFHLMSHAGIRPFKCSLCDYQVCNNAKVTRHIKAVHAGQEQAKCIKLDLTFEIDAKQFKCAEPVSEKDIDVIELTGDEMKEFSEKKEKEILLKKERKERQESTKLKRINNKKNVRTQSVKLMNLLRNSENCKGMHEESTVDSVDIVTIETSNIYVNENLSIPIK